MMCFISMSAIGIKQTRAGALQMAAFDPKRIFGDETIHQAV
jgi:hypothetical protein